MLKRLLINPFNNVIEIYLHMKSMISFIINNYATDSVDILLSKIVLFQDNKDSLKSYLKIVQGHLDSIYQEVSVKDELEMI